MSVSFLLTSFVICLAPGTGALYTIATGLLRGTRASVLAALAGRLGIVPHMLAAITGLAAVLRASGLASGITLNLLNPKLTIFFFAFLPQFVPAGSGSLQAMLSLSAVFMLMTFVTFVGYGVCAAAVRDHVLARPRILDRVRKVFALGFAGLGARLAIETH